MHTYVHKSAYTALVSSRCDAYTRHIAHTQTHTYTQQSCIHDEKQLEGLRDKLRGLKDSAYSSLTAAGGAGIPAKHFA